MKWKQILCTGMDQVCDSFPNQAPPGQGDAPPHKFLCNGRQTEGLIALKFPMAYGLCMLWQKIDPFRSGHGAVKS